MPKQVINPSGFPKPLAPYSSGTKADGIIYVSGTLAIDPDGSIHAPGDPAAQTRHVLETIKKVVEAGSGTLDDITLNHIFLTDWAHYAAMNAVYAEYFPGDKPARYCIQCGLVKSGLVVEIASIAHIGTHHDE